MAWALALRKTTAHFSPPPRRIPSPAMRVGEYLTRRRRGDGARRSRAGGGRGSREVVKETDPEVETSAGHGRDRARSGTLMTDGDEGTGRGSERVGKRRVPRLHSGTSPMIAMALAKRDVARAAKRGGGEESEAVHDEKLGCLGCMLDGTGCPSIETSSVIILMFDDGTKYNVTLPGRSSLQLRNAEDSLVRTRI